MSEFGNPNFDLPNFGEPTQVREGGDVPDVPIAHPGDASETAEQEADISPISVPDGRDGQETLSPSNTDTIDPPLSVPVDRISHDTAEIAPDTTESVEQDIDSSADTPLTPDDNPDSQNPESHPQETPGDNTEQESTGAGEDISADDGETDIDHEVTEYTTEPGTDIDTEDIDNQDNPADEDSLQVVQSQEQIDSVDQPDEIADDEHAAESSIIDAETPDTDLEPSELTEGETEQLNPDEADPDNLPDLAEAKTLELPDDQEPVIEGQIEVLVNGKWVPIDGEHLEDTAARIESMIRAIDTEAVKDAGAAEADALLDQVMNADKIPTDDELDQLQTTLERLVNYMQPARGEVDLADQATSEANDAHGIDNDKLKEVSSFIDSIDDPQLKSAFAAALELVKNQQEAVYDQMMHGQQSASEASDTPEASTDGSQRPPAPPDQPTDSPEPGGGDQDPPKPPDPPSRPSPESPEPPERPQPSESPKPTAEQEDYLQRVRSGLVAPPPPEPRVVIPRWKDVVGGIASMVAGMVAKPGRLALSVDSDSAGIKKDGIFLYSVPTTLRVNGRIHTFTVSVRAPNAHIAEIIARAKTAWK